MLKIQRMHLSTGICDQSQNLKGFGVDTDNGNDIEIVAGDSNANWAVCTYDNDYYFALTVVPMSANPRSID